MQHSNLDLRVWSWCLAATAVVALAGAGLGPARVEPPRGQATFGENLPAPAAGPMQQDRRVDDPPY